MEKFKRLIKEMRFEFKVLWIVVLILALSIPYNMIKKKFFPEPAPVVQLSGSVSGGGAGGKSLSDMQDNKAVESDDSKPGSISEAVSSERPLIIDESALNSNTEETSQTGNQNFDQMMTEMPEIKHMEVATQVENPTVWIYTLNDGLRKDDLAKNYCAVLHSKGIMASTVSVYDERGRKEGKLIELGNANCM